MKDRCIIVHPELGVFLGAFMNLAFWSCLGNAGGQFRAPVFESPEEAKACLKAWAIEGTMLDQFAFFSLPVGYGYDMDSVDPIIMQRAGVPAKLIGVALENEMLAARHFADLNHLRYN